MQRFVVISYSIDSLSLEGENPAKVCESCKICCEKSKNKHMHAHTLRERGKKTQVVGLLSFNSQNTRKQKSSHDPYTGHKISTQKCPIVLLLVLFSAQLLETPVFHYPRIC